MTALSIATIFLPIIALAYFAVRVVQGRRATRRLIELNTRRDCVLIAEQWPDDDYTGPLLPDRFAGLYEYAPAHEVHQRSEEWREQLTAAGNACCRPELPDELHLPILTVYAATGAHRMETREQYGKRLEKAICEANTAFHAALERQSHDNYRADYILRR